MKDRNENRPGYKKTKVGWIPEEWGCIPGKKLTTLIAKGSSPRWQGFEYSSFGMLFITSENVRDGYLNINQPKYLPFEFHKKLKRTQIKKGDILINLVGASIGRSCLVIRDIGPANVNQAVCVFRVREDVSREYVGYHFQAPTTVKRILDMQVDAARPNISLTDLRNLLIPLPTLPEQKKVAEILSTWDKAVEQTRKLLEAKELRKKALMRQLLTGHIRFSNFGSRATGLERFPDEWRVVMLGDLFNPVKRKNKKLSGKILTASGEYGLIPQEDFFNRSVVGESIQNYYLLKRGEFAYNRSSMKNYPYGAIKRLDVCDEGILSILYICFALNSKNCHSDFYKYFFESTLLNRELRAITQVGARAHGLLNIAATTFFSISIPKPPFEEQRRIAGMLSYIDEEIQGYKEKLKALEKQRRGLMQKLLTGEVRVTV